MHDTIKNAAQLTAYIAEGIAVLFIAFGMVKALWIYLRGTLLLRADYDATLKSRRHMGYSLSLGLEFLIGADILKTAISPTWQDIGQLAAIVAIRTVLNFFLMRELNEGEKIMGRPD